MFELVLLVLGLSLMPSLVIIGVVNFLSESVKRIPTFYVCVSSLFISAIIFSIFAFSVNLELEMGLLSLVFPLSILTIIVSLVMRPIYRKILANRRSTRNRHKIIREDYLLENSLQSLVFSVLLSIVAIIISLLCFQTAYIVITEISKEPSHLVTSVIVSLVSLLLISLAVVPAMVITLGIPVHLVMSKFGVNNVLVYVCLAAFTSHFIFQYSVFTLSSIVGAVVFWMTGVRQKPKYRV